MSDDVRADIEAERAVLGMLLDTADVDQVAKMLHAESFWQPRHSEIWQAITRIHEAGEPVGPQTVARDLTRAGSKVDPVYLAELHGGAPLAGDVTWYAQRIIDESAFRAIASAATKIGQAAANRGLTVDEVRGLALDAIDGAAGNGEDRKHVRVRDVLPTVLDMADKGADPALSTPWPDVDRVIGGIAPGRLVVVGARPAVGKSLMGTNLALQVADKHGHAALIASMEMDRTEVTQRILAAKARVDLGRLLSSSLTESEWDNVRRLHDETEALAITIDDAAIQTVASIRATARDIMRERDDLALIVVDYLQLMQAPDVSGKANRAEYVGAISRGLKVLARETGACVVAMAQVGREGVKNGARPTMGDLRESGAIEADANQVVLLHRPDEALPDIEVIVDKNRHGPKGLASLRLRGHYATLSSVGLSQKWGT